MNSAQGITSKAPGFTLMELMVVMLLVSIVLAAAIPRFEGGAFHDPDKKVSRWIINTVRTLRSTAIQKQQLQALVLDLNNSRMWIINESMDEETLSAAAEKAFSLPKSIQIVDVQYPQRDRITSGTTEIHFFPAGYSEQVLIHLENDDAQRFSFLVEPLLPKVKIFDEWIEFET